MNGAWGWACFNADAYLFELRHLRDFELKEEHLRVREELLDMGAMLKLPMIETVLAETITKKLGAELRLIETDLPESSYRDRAIIHARTRLLKAEAKAQLEAAEKIIAAVEAYEDALPEGVDGWMTEAGWK